MCWLIKPFSRECFALVRLVETWICKEKAVGTRLKGCSWQMSYLSYLESLLQSGRRGKERKRKRAAGSRFANDVLVFRKNCLHLFCCWKYPLYFSLFLASRIYFLCFQRLSEKNKTNITRVRFPNLESARQLRKNNKKWKEWALVVWEVGKRQNWKMSDVLRKWDKSGLGIHFQTGATRSPWIYIFLYHL